MRRSDVSILVMWSDIMVRVAAILLATLLAACGETTPNTIVSPALDSGIRSSNGGGERALGNQPNVGLTTRVTP